MINTSEILNEDSLFKHGFFKTALIEEHDFSRLIENTKKIQTNAEDQISGYSTDIYEELDDIDKKNLNKLASKLIEKKIVKRYLKFPNLIKIRVLKSKFNKIALEKPSHAMLWHRDLDDVFSQLKLIMPLNENNIKNGAFSVSSKKIASRDIILIDQKLKSNLKNSDNKYRIEDIVRVSDETFKKNFKDSIYEFVGNKGDMLFVDTNKCYHRGGQVLSDGLERYVIHFHIGQPTNSFHPMMQLKKGDIKKIPFYILGRFIRLLMKTYFFIINKQINSKKIILK